MPQDLYINSRIVIPGEELRWVSVRSSGPGGQNVNKVSTKVDLRFDIDSSAALSFTVKARLRGLAAGRLDAAGRIMIVSQATRNLATNLEDARNKLAALIRKALNPPKPRIETKPSRAARRRRLQAKRHNADKKKLRSRVSAPD